MQLSPEWRATNPAEPEAIAREVLAGKIAARYPVDDEGNPMGVTLADAALLKALMGGSRASRPAVTLRTRGDPTPRTRSEATRSG